MKAIQYYKYGPPSVLQVQEVAKPSPGPNQILLKIKATSVNPLDWHMYRGSPIFLRFMTGLFKPKNKFAGADAAGIVEEIGSEITDLEIGDEVFGDLYPFGYCAWSEYALVETGGLVKKPANVSFQQAGVTGIAALTAYQALKHQLNIQENEHVLINGASGGVGTFAVQIAKAFGAKVTGVCSAKNIEMVKNLGADEVIDYTSTDFTEGDTQYDHIMEIVLDHSRKEYARILKPGGTCLVIGFKDLTVRNFMKLAIKSLSKEENKIIKSFTAKSNQVDFQAIADMLENGQIKSVIEREYTLDQIVEACEYLEDGHVAGKLAIMI
jgi:NADPH:quinone reductase-like Zn-dependent oxidoreductase